MKNICKVVLAVSVTGFSINSFAQAMAIASTSSTIITPIAITKTVDMNFGNIAVSPAMGGMVVLDPASNRTTGGAGGVTLPVTAGSVSAASFTVAGAASYSYSITLPVSAVNLSSGSNNMNVTNFTSSPAYTGVLGPGGTQTLTVGATLNIAAGQTPGIYPATSPLSVTINYN